jgi:hypothetical protein
MAMSVVLKQPHDHYAPRRMMSGTAMHGHVAIARTSMHADHDMDMQRLMLNALHLIDPAKKRDRIEKRHLFGKKIVADWSDSLCDELCCQINLNCNASHWMSITAGSLLVVKMVQ